jgi:hypothetical protein
MMALPCCCVLDEFTQRFLPKLCSLLTILLIAQLTEKRAEPFLDELGGQRFEALIGNIVGFRRRREQVVEDERYEVVFECALKFSVDCCASE